MNTDENDKEIIPLKTRNKKAELNSTETIWLIIFSIIAAIMYTYINLS